MRFRVLPTLRIATGLLLAVLLGVVGYHVLHWRIPDSSEALLEQADEKSWVNNWIAAEPLSPANPKRHGHCSELFTSQT